MYNKPNKSLIVNRIEEQKANRYKNVYLFTLSVSPEEEKLFNEKLKKIINEIAQNTTAGGSPRTPLTSADVQN